MYNATFKIGEFTLHKAIESLTPRYHMMLSMPMGLSATLLNEEDSMPYRKLTFDLKDYCGHCMTATYEILDIS